MTLTSDKHTDEQADEQAETVDDAIGIEEAAEEPDADEAELESEPELEDTTRRWPRRVLIGALAAVFVASLALSGWLGWQLWQDKQVAQAGKQAQDAAVGYAQILTSIDSNKVDENFNQVLAGATGEFKDMYSKSSVQLRQLLIDNKASARGIVVQSAVQSASKDNVVVLLFVDQSVSNSTVPDPRIDRSRIRMTMDKVDGQWRTSKVELA